MRDVNEAIIAYLKTQLQNTDELLLAYYNELNVNNDDAERNAIRSWIQDIHRNVATAVAAIDQLNRELAKNDTTLTEVVKKAKAVKHGS